MYFRFLYSFNLHLFAWSHWPHFPGFVLTILEDTFFKCRQACCPLPGGDTVGFNSRATA